MGNYGQVQEIMASKSGGPIAPSSPSFPESPNDFSTEDDAPLLVGNMGSEEVEKPEEPSKEEEKKSFNSAEYTIAVSRFVVGKVCLHVRCS